jgi:Zn-dependent peptidase ImmA (M78 family)
VKRFIGAHELGHLYMRHQLSLDDEDILRRAPFSVSSHAEHYEREADAFASMVLAPAWLLALIVQRQKWPADALADPRTAYQLSLRLGTSYSATCYALERHKGITCAQRERLLSFEPKAIKRGLLYTSRRTGAPMFGCSRIATKGPSPKAVGTTSSSFASVKIMARVISGASRS